MLIFKTSSGMRHINNNFLRSKWIAKQSLSVALYLNNRKTIKRCICIVIGQTKQLITIKRCICIVIGQTKQLIII